MKRALFLTIILLGILGAQTAAVEIFNDNFDRPDGPLGPPWELLDASPLYIENQRVVAHADEYGLMIYEEPCPDCYCNEVTLLAIFNFSTNTNYDGRFQFFIGGGDNVVDYWGFIAKIGLDEVSLYSYDDVNGEVELLSVPSPLGYDFGYQLVFGYDPDAQTVFLYVYGPVALEVDMSVPIYSDPLCSCAIGIENLDAGGDDAWIDTVAFGYCCEPTAVEDFDAGSDLAAWPQPFSSTVRLRAGGRHPDGDVEIFDVRGRRVALVPLRDGMARWDGAHVPAGLYLARIAGAPESATVRLIKLH